MEHRSLLKKLSGDSLVYSISIISTRLISFILFPLFARKFTPDDYGIIGVLSTLGFFVGTLCSLGMDSAAARWYYDNDDIDRKRSVFTSWLVVQGGATIVLSVLLILTSYILPINVFLHTDRARLLLFLVCLNLICNLPLSVVNLYCVVHRRPFYSMYLSIASAAISTIASLLLVFVFQLGLVGFYFGQTIAFFLCSLAGILFFFRKLIAPKLPSMDFMVKMIRYGVSIIPANISSYFLLFLASLIIHQYTSQTELGFYQVGYTLATGISLISVPFNQAFQPMSYSIMYQPGAGRFCALIMDFYVLVMCTVCLALGLFFSELVHLLLTSKYLQSDFVAASLSFANFIYSLNVIAVVGMAREKKIKYFGTIVTICNFMIIGLVFFGTYYWGINGAASSFVLGNFITVATLFYFSQRIYYIPYRLLPNGLLIIIAVCLFLVGYRVDHSTIEHSFWWRLLIMFIFLTLVLISSLKSHLFTSIKNYVITTLKSNE